jgi:DNA sulfur modification protein DndD
MILDKLVLHNFGVYRDRQEIMLAPASQAKPIVLLGGLNGTGKTTLLDALQLVLYGKRARLSNRNGVAYPDYLLRSIHRSVAPHDGAAIELEFRHHSEGQGHAYRVARTWRATGRGLSEHVQVDQDGQQNDVLTEHWDDHVEQFMPLGLSRLLLFDGEQIEHLADPASSSELLRTGFHALLGLDLVDQLCIDLDLLVRRKQLAMVNEKDRKGLDPREQEIERLRQRIEVAVQAAASARNIADERLGEHRAADQRFRSEGGELLAQRVQLEDVLGVLRKDLESVEAELREIAAGDMPLLLLPDMIRDLADRDASEEGKQRAAVLRDALAERGGRVLRSLQGMGLAEEIVERVADVLAADLQALDTGIQEPEQIRMSAEARGALHGLLGGGADATHRHAHGLLQREESIRSEIVRSQRKIAAIPDEDAMRAIVQARDDAAARLRAAEDEVRVQETSLARLREELESLEAELRSEIELALDADFASEDSQRAVRRATSVRQVLGTFREAVLRRHVERIRALVMESLGALLRKKGLVSNIEIDPQTFVLHVLGQDGIELNPDRLSMGERQLVAVSLLWGLARASGRALPAVIDTPLGRLDSRHRRNIVRNYFPNASHQVLLLSTDEEIDSRYYADLKPWVGREYRLEHDDSVGATRVVPGYFWEGQPQ